MTATSGPRFGACLEFMDNRVVVRLRGDIDTRTYSDLGAVLDAVLDGGHRDVVLEAPDLRFIDGHAVVLLSRVARAMDSAGGRLVVRAPAAPTRWLDATALNEIVDWEPPNEEVDGALRRVAAYPADREVLRSALRLVVELAEAMVEGAHVATISLAPRGRLRDVISTNDEIAVLDHEQYTLGEGPCLEAAEERQPMHVVAAGTENRWPIFMSRAQDLGVNSILSTPLRSGEGAFGALNLYAFHDRAFPPWSQELAGTLADRAARVLVAAGPDLAAEDIAASLRSALEARQSIAVAQGLLVERHGLSPDAAYTRLRRSSQETSRPLRDVAQDIIASVVPEHSVKEGH